MAFPMPRTVTQTVFEKEGCLATSAADGALVWRFVCSVFRWGSVLLSQQQVAHWFDELLM